MVIQVEEQEEKRVSFKMPIPYKISQDEFVRCTSLRQMIKAGRRSGKTFGVAIKHVMAFLGICWGCLGEGCELCDQTGRVKQKRSLYAAPTAEQVGKFWFEVVKVLSPGIDAGYFKKDETEHVIEIPGTEVRIKAKTAWNAATMRGDFAEVITLEEYQLWNEDAWQDVVQPMLIDFNGTAIFIFTPPSLKSEGVSKAKDPRHASKLFNKALLDKSGRWETFHFTTYDNPYLSQDALKELTTSGDMSADSYRREILAEDDEIESSWLVYGKFNEELCKIKRFTIPDNWPVFSGHDFGTANPAALFVAQVRLPLPPNASLHLRLGDYVAFAEYAPGAGFSAVQHIDKFKDILERKDDGTSRLKLERAVGGNVTSEEEIRQLYRNLGWPIRAPESVSEKHKGSKDYQIDRAKAIIEQNQFYIFEDLHQILHQIADCMWIVDEEKHVTNKVRDEAKYHLLACFVEGTMITTDEGLVPIEKIKVGDKVLTRQGYQRVANAGKTDDNAETITAYFSDGTTLIGTPDHPVFVKGKGFVPLTCLRYGDTMEVWKEKRLSIEAQSTIAIRNRKGGVTASILSPQRVISIESCGKTPLEKFREVALSTTKIMILPITNYLTLDVKAMGSICQTIWQSMYGLMNKCLTLPEYALLQEMVGGDGLKHQKGKIICGSVYGRTLNIIRGNVNSVGRNTRLGTSVLVPVGFVQTTANRLTGGTCEKMMRSDNVPSVEQASDVINTSPQEHAQEDVKFLRVKPHSKAKVYNLSVENTPEYYANGILVHNCLRYLATVLVPKQVLGKYKIKGVSF